MIEIQDLKKSFGTKDVLNGVSLQVGDGMIYGLVGRNGAGKTTLITTVAGLQSPTAGQCRVNGKPVIPHQTGTTVGYLPDVPAYFDFLSVGEYLDCTPAKLAWPSRHLLMCSTSVAAPFHFLVCPFSSLPATIS